MIAGRPGTQLTAETGHAFPHAGQASAACPSARRLAGLAGQRRDDRPQYRGAAGPA
jgi:hypothetical protein